ncbi:MAG: hypothetical protein IJN46_10870 [Lachnospiraceae bacterium]|nr:hypothetical protein [Lachnospiraceae bacterium]
MNIRKNIDYTEMYEALDELMAQHMPQMGLYYEIGKIVCRRTEKGAAVMASEYLNKHYPDVKGFSPRSLRRMRDFYRTYEGRPSLLSRAMKLGWTLNVVIMEADLTMDLREWYTKAAEQFGWSKSELIAAIDANVHESMILHTKEEVYPLAENDSENDKSEDIKIVNRIADRWLLKFIKAIIGLWRYASSGGVLYIKIRNIAVMRC